MPITVRLCLCFALTACGEFPEAGKPSAANRAYPDLEPMSQLIDNPSPDANPEELTPDELLQARAAALQARADALRNTPF